jgi:hypothetical protein
MIYVLLVFLLISREPGSSGCRDKQSALAAVAGSHSHLLRRYCGSAGSLCSQPPVYSRMEGAARCGWVDGFHEGKVLFATAALYRLEVMGADGGAGWVILGLYCGAVTSVLCQIFAFTCLDLRELMPLILLVVYIPVSYCWRAVQLGRRWNLPFLNYLSATLGMLPFWIGSWYWSRTVFDALPNVEPKGCFVVTAAGQGHPSWVGPFFEIEHNGARRRVNRQLETFWQFEKDCRKLSPVTHGAFRKLYNRIGPSIAACAQADGVRIAGGAPHRQLGLDYYSCWKSLPQELRDLRHWNRERAYFLRRRIEEKQLKFRGSGWDL